MDTFNFLLFAIVVFLNGVIVHGGYSVKVLNRSLTGAPLLSFKRNTSKFENTLNAAWLPLPGKGNEGGGLFYRALGSSKIDSFNAVGFVRSLTADSLKYEVPEPSNLLYDDPENRTLQNSGADPRAVARPLTGEYFVTYQESSAEYPGRHTFISRSKTPLNLTSWTRDVDPMFKNITDASGAPLARATTLVDCDSSDESQLWIIDGAKEKEVIRNV